MISPFTRLARVHLLNAAGDALVAIALAGSLFFNLDPAAARPKVALYLLLTIAPFAVVGPLIGPVIDRARGGRRGVILVSATGRAILAVLMIRHLDSLLLFPEAFGILVLGKTYHVSKSALVPGLVREKADLVEANSKLSLLSGVGAILAAGPGLLLNLLGSGWVLAAATIAFAWMIPMAVRVPRTQVATAPPDAHERSELRSAGIVMAASAMAVLRSMTGFTLFLIAFWLRNDGAATGWFGAMIVASSIGQLSGAVAAPHLRKVIREEHLLGGILAVASLVSGDADGRVRPRDGHRSGGRSGKAVVRRHRPARCPRCEPGPLVRSVRDPIPADLGARRHRSRRGPERDPAHQGGDHHARCSQWGGVVPVSRWAVGASSGASHPLADHRLASVDGRALSASAVAAA